MKIITLILCFVSITCFAGVKSFYLKLPLFNYVTPVGVGVLDQIQIDFDKNYVNPMNFEIEKKDQAFYLRSDFFQVTKSDPSSFLLNLKNLKLNKLEMNYNTASSLQLNFANIIHPSLSGNASLNKLNMLCTGATLESRFFWQKLLSQCSSKSKLTIKELDFPMLDKIIRESSQNTRDEGEEDISQIAEDVEISFDKQDFFFGLKSQVYVNVRVKAWGRLTDDRVKKEIKIYIKEVKVGFLDITKQVLSALKENVNGDNIRFEGNNIFISYK
jgi:hypothetical protein